MTYTKAAAYNFSWKRYLRTVSSVATNGLIESTINKHTMDLEIYTGALRDIHYIRFLYNITKWYFTRRTEKKYRIVWTHQELEWLTIFAQPNLLNCMRDHICYIDEKMDYTQDVGIYAAKYGRIDVIRQLKWVQKQNTLTSAIEHGQFEVMKFLFDDGKRNVPTSKDSYSDSSSCVLQELFMTAAKHNRIDILEYMFESGRRYPRFFISNFEIQNYTLAVQWALSKPNLDMGFDRVLRENEWIDETIDRLEPLYIPLYTRNSITGIYVKDIVGNSN